MKSTLTQNDTKKGKKETVDKIEMQHDVTAVRQMYAVNLYGGPQLPKLRITRQINGSINKNSIKNNLFASAFIVTSAEEVIFSHMFIYLLVLSQNYTKTI